MRITLASSAIIYLLMPLAHASCLPGVPPPTYYVGSDSMCQYSTIQSAINAVPSPTSCAPHIVISAEHAWMEHLTIANRSLSLIGSAASCGIGGTGGIKGVSEAPDATPTQPIVTISGGETNNNVLTITGNSNVTLQYLEITGGNLTGSDSEGGGILFAGSGSLTLNTTTVDNNKAAYGAGIDVSPSGSATLTLQTYTLVIENQAAISGGGIRIEGNTSLVAVADQTLIGFNSALSGYGGGIEVLGPAYANIGSPGYGAEGVIFSNTASYGGGIAGVAIDTDGDIPYVQMFTTVADRPVSVANNIATIAGGGIYMRGKNYGLSGVTPSLACLYDFRVNGNTAPEGAALAVDADTSVVAKSESGSVYLNIPYNANNCGPQAPPAFNSVQCAAGTSCNEFSGNTGEDSQGTPSGAVIFVGTNSYFQGERFSVQKNQAAYAIHMYGGDDGYESYLYSKACLVADNQLSKQVFFGDGDYFGLEFTNCTMAHDAISGNNVIALGTNTTLSMYNDIFDEIGKPTVDAPGDATLHMGYIMSNDISTLPTSTTIIAQNLTDPLFVDAANSNYRLVAYNQNGSLTATRAIDFAPTAGYGPTYDLVGKTYGQDVVPVPDAYGARDLGAYEALPISDRVFSDGFGDRVLLVH